MRHRRLPRVDLPSHTYALTCCLDQRRRLFTDPDLTRALIALWAEARDRGDDDWRTKLTYLHDNPVRAGMVEVSTDYPWSSAAFWETGIGPVTCHGVDW